MASIIKDIVNRTNGELYIGVVGSVRSGKSTFIRKFMELKVLPHVIEDKNKIIDELPQSSAGKTIMTVEPKFVPSNPVNITLENEINFNVRLVDCVGYVIENSKGYLNEDGSMKLVNTPWFAEEIPFLEAATLGTKKVMENHSNLGVIVTSDGSFGDFNREDYENIEEKLIKFLEQSVEAKKGFEKYKNAIESVNQVGYGIAAPVIDDMSLDEPSIIKQGGKFGVKLRALAPSIVMFKVDIESIFEPIIGTEEQSNKLLEKIMNDYDNDHSSIWQAEIFGRKLSEVVNDGVKAKLFMVPDTIQNKMRDCMEKIVNKGKGGVLAIIL